ncbi:MAG TPA: hypothetical protein VGI10_30860 [Polyangiaceae bacterium]|jgi:hypothetical protein
MTPCRWGFAATLLVACNVTKGFSDAANDLVPEQKSYLEPGGEPLVPGTFHDLRLAIKQGSSAYLTARPGQAGDAGRSLDVIDIQHQSLCELPNVAEYDTDFVKRLTPSPLIAYLEASDDSGQGTLRFADPACRLSALSVPGASWPPIDVIDSAWPPIGASAVSGFAVRVGSALVAVDPFQGVSRTLVNTFTEAHPFVAWDSVAYHIEWLVVGDGQVIVYDPTWQEIERFGSGVDGLALEFGLANPTIDARFTDVSGLHRLTLNPAQASLDMDTLLEPGACQAHLGSRPDYAYFQDQVLYRSPCGDSSHLIFRSDKMRFQFDVDADPSLAQIAVFSSPILPLLAFLKGPVTGSRRGELEIAVPSDVSALDGSVPPSLTALKAPLSAGTQWALAQNAELDSIAWTEDLYAIVDSDGTSGEIARFNLDTTNGAVLARSALAEQVLLQLPDALPPHQPRRSYPNLLSDLLLANATSNTADLVAFCDCYSSSFQSYASQVPIHGFMSYTDDTFYTGKKPNWVALVLAGFDGSAGTLSAWSDGALPLKLATGVTPGKFASLEPIELLGAAFISGWNEQSGAGLLEYVNAELGVRQPIHAGVSELIPVFWPESGVLFVVPNGDDAGIWFTLAK